MRSTCFRRPATLHDRQPPAPHIFAHRLTAFRDPDADEWDDEEDPLGGEAWDPDVPDDDEPQPERGDFWPEPDDE